MLSVELLARWNRTEEELLGARADPLLRIAERLEKQLAELERLRRIALNEPPGSRELTVSQHTALLERARRQRWYMVVQREAVGLRQHAILAELYPLPRPLERSS